MLQLPIAENTPPSSNTGVNQIKIDSPLLVEVGLDWLAGSFPGEMFNDVKDKLEKVFADKFLDEVVSDRWYKTIYRSYKGISIANNKRVVSQTDAYISLPASALAFLKAQSQLDLLKYLFEIGFSCSRVDIKLDDYSKTLTPELVYEACEINNYTGFQTGANKKLIINNHRGVKTKTFYLGRRGKSGSGKFLRVYNKSIQSEGSIDSNRLEIEFSQHYSKQIFQDLVLLEVELWSEAMKTILCGAIDFLDRQSDNGLIAPNRCQRLDWWQLIVESIPRTRYSKYVPPKSIERSISWIKKQVMPTLSLVFSYINATQSFEALELFWWKLWLDGEARWSDEQRFIYQQAIAACV